MFKIKSLLIGAILFTTISCANAFTVGYVDYAKVLENYSYAKTTFADLEDRALEMQRYLMDKEKEFKKIESPIQKKQYKDKIEKEFATKEEDFAKYKIKKQKEIYDTIIKTMKAVAVEQQIDTILDSAVIYTGGVDVTDKVIQKLNLKK